MPAFKDLTGLTFERWKVLELVSRKPAKYLCRCLCGKTRIVLGNSLTTLQSKSCGCVSNEKNIKHGLTKTDEHNIWIGMKNRCNNPNVQAYPHYGGRGISVCERWKKFENFLEDVGKRPSKKHSLERIDNDGNYEPTNVKWATLKEQGNNRRNTVMLEYKGKKQSIIDWSKELNININTLYNRIFVYSWNIESAFELPINANLFRFNGEAKTIKQLCEIKEINIYRLPKHTIIRRIRVLKWDINTAFSTPPSRKTRYASLVPLSSSDTPLDKEQD